jgi:response regulator RpfG family c-di-GMP phosphodiesterase
VIGQDELKIELRELREELAERQTEAADKERQLERYASDLRETFKAERARADELRASYVATVRALTNAVEARDAYTAKHAERVAAYGLELLRRVDETLAANPQIEFGFLLHDVGKVAIPDGILHKADRLAGDEERLMRRHPVIGWEIVRAVPFLEQAAEIVRYHHEHFDGSGYPDGLKDDEIPLAARVFAVADAFDAITTERPYRPAAPMGEARGAIAAAAGTHFDPRVVAVLGEIPDETLERIRTEVA